MPDETFTISNDLRTISPPGPFFLGVYNDANVRTISFTIPRYYCNEDFDEYTIKINVKNANNDLEADEAENVSTNNDTITFDWVLKRFVFAKEGTVYFNIFLSKDDSTNRFHTSIYKGTVLSGLKMDDEKRQSTLYRLELLKEEADASNEGEIVVGVASFTSLQLGELIDYLSF